VNDKKQEPPPPTEAELRGRAIVDGTKIEDASVTVELAHPIPLNNVPAAGKALTLRRASGADQIWIEENEGNMDAAVKNHELIGRLSGTAPADIAHLTFFDMAVIQEVVAGFCFLS
jgi:hypothetical protein